MKNPQPLVRFIVGCDPEHYDFILVGRAVKKAFTMSLLDMIVEYTWNTDQKTAFYLRRNKASILIKKTT